jgi:hypothetical protein
MSTIKNFGFMWEREKVDWGRQARGAKARFEGVMVGNTKRIVDFRKQMGIYVSYDKFEQPIQIGQTRRIFGRLRDHKRDHLRNRWNYFSWFGFFKVGARNELLWRDQAEELKRSLTLADSLNEIEAVLIQVLEPKLNRRGPNWKETEEYLQWDPRGFDEDEDLTEDEE